MISTHLTGVSRCLAMLNVTVLTFSLDSCELLEAAHADLSSRRAMLAEVDLANRFGLARCLPWIAVICPPLPRDFDQNCCDGFVIRPADEWNEPSGSTRSAWFEQRQQKKTRRKKKKNSTSYVGEIHFTQKTRLNCNRCGLVVNRAKATSRDRPEPVPVFGMPKPGFFFTDADHKLFASPPKLFSYGDDRRRRGVENYLLEHFFASLNRTFEVIDIDKSRRIKFGINFDKAKGHFEGLLDEVASRRALLGVGSINAMFTRTPYMDFSYPYHVEGLHVMTVPKPVPVSVAAIQAIFQVQCLLFHLGLATISVLIIWYIFNVRMLRSCELLICLYFLPIYGHPDLGEDGAGTSIFVQLCRFAAVITADLLRKSFLQLLQFRSYGGVIGTLHEAADFGRTNDLKTYIYADFRNYLLETVDPQLRDRTSTALMSLLADPRRVIYNANLTRITMNGKVMIINTAGSLVKLAQILPEPHNSAVHIVAEVITNQLYCFAFQRGCSLRRNLSSLQSRFMNSGLVDFWMLRCGIGESVAFMRPPFKSLTMSDLSRILRTLFDVAGKIVPTIFAAELCSKGLLRLNRKFRLVPSRWQSKKARKRNWMKQKV